MPQTLLAFLAMMIAALASMNQYTAQLQGYEAMYRSEFELMANALVLEEIEIIDLTTNFSALGALDGEERTRSFEVGAVAIEFGLTISVIYVDESGAPSGGATPQREVAISATHPRFTTPLVTHKRIIV
jgi:hypothetical protein